jgi:hypothetical protein
MTFFDETSELQCKTYCVNKAFYINNTLGWILGYRVPDEPILPDGNQATSILDLIGTRYLILVIDDYNQNHLNNGLVSITELSKTLKLPTYYSPDLPYTCVPPTTTGNNFHFQPEEKMLPSAPRVLTQSQIYTINEIIKNNDRTTNFRAKAPTTSDVFALIPIKGGLSLGQLYVELSGSLQDFKRTYFGPVNIDRMRVTLLDDKGNVINLNGAEWSITLITENLYQY